MEEKNEWAPKMLILPGKENAMVLISKWQILVLQNGKLLVSEGSWQRKGESVKNPAGLVSYLSFQTPKIAI